MSLNVDLLQETFQRAKRENGGLTHLGLSFYQRLFSKYPQVKHLFTTPPEEQHKKLMASVSAIVASVTMPDKMMPYLRAMGIRHLAYKTETPHYAAVTENLLAVLADHLSVEGEWSPEAQATWEAALAVVCDIMIDAAENADKYSEEMLSNGYLPNGFKTDDPMPWLLEAV